jgi:hypothetical protein
MITIKRYNPNEATAWDSFVDASKNGTFMLKRGYMDYHADRFMDHSLLFYRDEELVALLPASRHGDELRSHGGLTYGGLIMSKKIMAQQVLDIFDALKSYLKENGFESLLYKRIPNIYYRYPSDEDLYALFRYGANLVRRDISSTIYLPSKINFSERRRRGCKLATKNNIEVRQSFDFERYIELLTDVLKKYHNAIPVHTALELQLLANNFPENIKLYAAYSGDRMLAGVVLYVTETVAHAQYIANSDEGRCIGALDCIFDFLINNQFSMIEYFDFGISTENAGLYLNEGLITQKQEFGGRAIAYDFYELKV